MPLQSVTLADGRHFIGVYDPAAGTVMVHAAVRGGRVTRMQAISIHVEAAMVSAVTAYDGSLGDLGQAYVPAPVDAARAVELAQARDATAALAERHRQEVAEHEQERQRAARRAEAAQRLDDAKVGLLSLAQREQYLTEHATVLADDHRVKLELGNSLQLQLNTAMDRWNLEVQNLGPRQTKPDGTVTGGPTPATEALVGLLQRQIQQAHQALTQNEETRRAESAERQDLLAERSRLTAAVETATEALKSLPP